MTTITIEARAAKMAEKIWQRMDSQKFLTLPSLQEIVAIITAEMAGDVNIESLAKRIAARAFRMRSNQEIVECAALEELTASVGLANVTVESALAALRKHLGPYPQLIISVRDCGKETRTVRGTTLEYGIQVGMNGNEFDADTLAAALNAAMEGE